MDKAKTSGGFTNFNGTSLLEKPKSESISSLDGMSDSEGGGDSDTNGGTNFSSGSAAKSEKSFESFGPTAKRLKGSTGSSSPDERTSSPKVVIH